MSGTSAFRWSLLFLFVVAVVAIVVMVRPSWHGGSSLTGAAIRAGDVPSGYAPPWDVWTNDQFLWFTQDGGVGRVEVSRPGAYIYNTFFVSVGDTWVPHKFGTGRWLRDEAKATVPLPKDAQYVIVYTCVQNPHAPDGWDCGCQNVDDKECRRYAIQELESSLTSFGCSSDADCTPGVCIEGTCVDTPECSSDADCEAGASCKDGVCTSDVNNQEGEVTGEGYGSSSPSKLCASDAKIIYEKDDLWTCPHKSSEKDAPAFGINLFIPWLSTFYTTDYMGMSSFKVDGANLGEEKSVDFFTPQSPVGVASTADHYCTPDYDAGKAPFCIGTDFDCGTPRTYVAPQYAGGDEVYTHTKTPYATHDSWLLFGEVGASFHLLAEVFRTSCAPTLHGPKCTNGVLNREGGGVAIFGSGIDGLNGIYEAFFKVGDERYGLLNEGTLLKLKATTTGPYLLINLTDLHHPREIGDPDPLFVELFEQKNDGAYGINYNSLHLLGRYEGEEYVVYDISNPLRVEEVARAPLPSDVTALDGRRPMTLLFKDDGALYLLLQGGMDYELYGNLSATRVRVEKCGTSKGHFRACYEGELYKFVQNRQGPAWVKVMDVPFLSLHSSASTGFDIRHGKLYVYGREVTPGELHTWTDYLGRTSQLEVEPQYSLQVFDIATGKRLLKKPITLPLLNDPPLAVSADGQTVYLLRSSPVVYPGSTRIYAVTLSDC